VIDLIELAKSGKLDPVICGDDEVIYHIEYLNR